jgi:hypothetical protein
MHAIAWLFEPWLRTLLPATGRHRAGATPPHVAHAPARRQQGNRRCALWPATQGVDVGPRRIHDVEVAAR